MSTSVSPIVESKLNPPALLLTQVLRTQISEQIVAAAVKLVLVQAPAGFGKTTAMAQSRQRLESEGVATAWLTLDRADNDASRFAACLSEAVSRLGVEVLGDGDPFNAIATFDSPFALFLDDFEVVHEAAVLGRVREMIEHLPRGGRLVIGSRGMPDLGLGRLRARGQLAEIDAQRLRFSVDEARAFFDLHLGPRGQPLSPAMLALLHRKTEGWVAAIWLASLALKRHGLDSGFVERFSGSDRAVADYLAEDVLVHQPQDVHDFLLRTSILRQLDASVCQALNPRLDCAAILERLATANLFLTPISGDTPAWRYHSLFADFLRARLARDRPDEMARLHLAASGWYESQCRPVPAIDHAIEGGDHPHALTLLDSYAEQFLEQGRMRLLSRWFSAIPEYQLREKPSLQPIALWASCFTNGPWEAMTKLDAWGCARSECPEVRANARALYPLLLTMQDRCDEAYVAGVESLARLPTGQAFADSTLLNTMASVIAIVGDQHESQRLLDTARGKQGNSAFSRMYTESLEGIFDLEGGRLRQATARFRMAVDSTHAVSYNHSHGNAWAGVLYTGVVYETNQLQEADRLLNVYLPLARDVGLPDHMILSHVMRSRIAFHAGDIDTAFQALTELEYLGHQRQLPRVVASAKLERSRILLLQGNGPTSREELSRAEAPELWERVRRQRLAAHDLDDLALGKARWDIAFGDAHTALSAIDAELHTAIAGARSRRALKLRVLRSLALQSAGNVSAAIEEIGTTLQAASQEGFMRLILDEGPAVGTLIQRYAITAQEAAAMGGPSNPILTEYVQRVLQVIGPQVQVDLDAHATKGSVEPLTRKEIRVLQLLAEGYSNRAIAEKLYVSDSTVRTHLRNINMKLDAASRTQAVAIARKLGMIR